MKQETSNRVILTLLMIVGLIFAWSAISPKDYFTWFLEVFPVILGVIVLFATFRGFRFTDLLYYLIAIHAVILIVGGHYTYAEVPLFNWIRDALNLSRNHYDRIGHLAQGFIPAMIAREVFLRHTPLKKGAWLFFIVCCFALALSAFYEFIEWWVAVASGTAAEAFLGTQGDVWDTQWDMFLACIGSVLAQVFLSGLHDKQLSRLISDNPILRND